MAHPYTPQPDASTADRIAALRVILGGDDDEIAATLVDEDETTYPGSWAALGMDRGAALSEYLHELERHPYGARRMSAALHSLAAPLDPHSRRV